MKWGKEKFSEIECNTDEAPLIFKSALYSLTGVVPERMKVMVKGKAIGVSKIYVRVLQLGIGQQERYFISQHKLVFVYPSSYLRTLVTRSNLSIRP